MRTIYKYVIEPETELQLPAGSLFLHAGEQKGDIFLWFEIDTTFPLVNRLFKIYPTGVNMPIVELNCAERKFLATVQMRNGLVFHIYDVGVSK